ncbi:putative ABC transporter permease protein [Sporomusa silvacetica DSM 10669]|uniref:ABC transporter permease protein n=1 Tax=Sporomusa silvacetica DSM 10669 TaxID=1123289 RepID=A0ABZ3INC2_9FIRM|nr:iron ABC transporter permease [Sporomusa silvacetica]OZC14380.1 putative ABC transporter permease protein [Sporomusa silvacetica DSM 10669]
MQFRNIVDKSRISQSSLFLILPIMVFIFSFVIGHHSISLTTVINILAARVLPIDPTWPPMLEQVIYQVRLPRIIAAMLVGAGLSAAGAAFQGVFRNPLVSPYILGVSSGAGFGAALAILLADNIVMVQISALFFGILAVVLTYGISSVYKSAPTLVLILSGVIVGSFFSALLSLLKYLADPYEKLPSIVFWLMGSLANVNSNSLLTLGPILVIAVSLLVVMGWRINVLSMGEEEALSFGVNTHRERAIIVVLCTIITAIAVCLTGIIGWVGLVIPHICRMLVGPDYRKVIMASISIGACYLLIIDDLARALTSLEIPLGILTALLGAPFFAYLIMKNKVGW